MTDLHRAKAAEIFGVPEEAVTDAQRKYAKMVNYVGNYSNPDTIGEVMNRMKKEAQPAIGFITIRHRRE